MRRELGTHVPGGGVAHPEFARCLLAPPTPRAGEAKAEAVTDLNRRSYCAIESKWPLR
jgi:hypothetical protein